MVANFGPAASNWDETVSTLRYAGTEIPRQGLCVVQLVFLIYSLFLISDRAKHIKNKPRINEDPKDTAIRKYLDVCPFLSLSQLLWLH